MSSQNSTTTSRWQLRPAGVVLVIILLLVGAGLLLLGLSGLLAWNLVWIIARNFLIFVLAALILGVLLGSFFRPGKSVGSYIAGILLGLLFNLPVLIGAYLYQVAPVLLLVGTPLMENVQHVLLVIAVILGFGIGISWARAGPQEQQNEQLEAS